MRSHSFRSVLLCLLISGCGDLFGDEPPPPTTDPALQPPPPVEPVPSPAPTPTPAPSPQGTDPQAGGLEIPGLPGLRLPLPVPNPNAPPREPPARGSLAAPPPGSHDPQGFMTRQFLEQEAVEVHRVLVEALWEAERNQARPIPFEIVSEASEPNAAAGCTRASRQPVMMITSAMLELCAGIAETKAYDEVAGTSTYEQYVGTVIDQVRAERPIEGPSPSLLSGPNALDAHKLARQRHLFDQQIAFILGHELAHHYRGHTTCVAGRTEEQIQHDDLAAQLAHTVPPFEQPREVEADMWGASNVLEAGRNRPGGTWTEEGGLLNLDFFRRLSDRGGAELIMAFLSTHPPSAVRIPIVRSIAQQWEPGRRPPAMPRVGETSGQGIDLGGIRLPVDPSQLPIDPQRLPLPFPLPQGSPQPQPQQP